MPRQEKFKANSRVNFAKFSGLWLKLSKKQLNPYIFVDDIDDVLGRCDSRNQTGYQLGAELPRKLKFAHASALGQKARFLNLFI